MEHTALGVLPHACPPAVRASAYLIKGKQPMLSFHVLNQSKLMPKELPALARNPVTALRRQGVLCVPQVAQTQLHNWI